ncbi:MAG: hypothetical protein KDF60_13720 [Calditrichaeota bacterium]|nr:hypothetical protein [Calditrichota bacterium]
MKLLKILCYAILVVQIGNIQLSAQGKPYEGPDDPAGDIEAEREGYMTGNRVLIYFRNNTELANWTTTYVGSAWSRWPDDETGVRMLDGVALMIGAKVYIKNDTIPVTDPIEIANKLYDDNLYYLQTSYRGWMDKSSLGTIEWGLYPVYGYLNEYNEYVAMSNRPSSWPTAGWPARGNTLKWQGEWNGRFGRGVAYADLETFFVANDAQDQEYLEATDRVKYYPRPNVKIGDIRPQVTIQKGRPWGGIGVRVAQRGFQWNNPQARDAIFWEYSIANISDYDLPEVAFGLHIDNGIGADAPSDDLAFFDKQLDMAYSWDIDGIGAGGLSTGAMGFAYLETPGLAYDNIDNDNDGLLDEKRDNPAGSIVGPTSNIDDIQKFLEFYNLKMDDLREHYEGDEDQDWDDGNDLNGDGIYQPYEDAGDDVGLDGVGPGDLNYTGPDEGECNHKPDFVVGLGCEPDFNATDVSESDMIGLTAFEMSLIPASAPDSKIFSHDKPMWDMMTSDTLIEYNGVIGNLLERFASATFPLYRAQEERISMAEIPSYDALAGLNSSTHDAPVLFAKKRIVQVIYEKDYRFAQPPKMPTLTATAGDGKVVLTWNDVADTKTRDPFMGNVNDFQGYKIFKATDTKFSDARTITDGYGDRSVFKPVFQCDLNDGVKGFVYYGAINGVGYNLGYDTGIVHHWVDTEVQNGRTYYYAIVAYDSGASNIGTGISPSENNVVVELSETDEVRILENGNYAIGQNVAVVVPHQQALGYVPPSIDIEQREGLVGTALVEPEILANSSIKPVSEYFVVFDVDTIVQSIGNLYKNSGLRIYKVNSESSQDYSLVYQESPESYSYSNLVEIDSANWAFRTNEDISTDVFDGLRLRMNFKTVTAGYDYETSGWLVGHSDITISPAPSERNIFPWDYDIIFTDNDHSYVGRVSSTGRIYDENGTRILGSKLLFNYPFNFYVQNKSVTDSTGEYKIMDMIVYDTNLNSRFDWNTDRILVGELDNQANWEGTVFSFNFNNVPDSLSLPVADDVYRIKQNRPFAVTDTIKFQVNPEGLVNTNEISTSLDKIKVVPNPYIAGNAMEPAVLSPLRSQQRRLLFTHIPAKCTIKIFSVSGVLVDVIEVQNEPNNGIIHWDLKTKEGLEIAAGIYIYHVKSHVTGDERISKFAIIK